MADIEIKKPTQYTVKGIRLGKFDDDLDRLLRAVQRRRAAIGAVHVINIGKPPEPASSEADEAPSSGMNEPLMKWDYNGDKLPDPHRHMIDKFHDGSYNHVDLTRRAFSVAPSICVNDVFFRKTELVDRVIALHDDAASETGFSILYVVSIARRNLTCLPLMLSAARASTRTYNAARKKALSGQTVVIKPEQVADLVQGGDHVKAAYMNGVTGVRG